MKTNKIHTPVLAKELIDNLNINPAGTYVDCTAGFGGHSSLILKKLTTGKLICIDRDINAIKALHDVFAHKSNVTIVHNNFCGLKYLINAPVDGIIMDLGVSSLMFDDPKRGFSYKQDGPLDMRMDQRSALTAADVVNTYTREQLIEVFTQYGEAKNVNAVVKAILAYRKVKPFETTLELANLIGDCFKGSLIRKHPAKTYFQAIRIEVNGEFEALNTAMQDATNLLKKNGRLAIITFHSLEDRTVKTYFKEISEVKDMYGKDVPVSKLIKPNFKLITKKPIVPSLKEIEANRRSHSAKLRVVERV